MKVILTCFHSWIVGTEWVIGLLLFTFLLFYFIFVLFLNPRWYWTQSFRHAKHVFWYTATPPVLHLHFKWHSLPWYFSFALPAIQLTWENLRMGRKVFNMLISSKFLVVTIGKWHCRVSNPHTSIACYVHTSYVA